MRYKNITNACKKSHFGGINLSNIISERFYHTKKGWTKLLIDDFKIDELVSVIGGRGNDYKRLIEYMIDHKITYGIFERLNFNGKRWSYIAGQDYTAELNLIRKLLRD